MASDSLSRDLRMDSTVPTLVHSLHELKSSVLSLEADDEDYIFSGTQNQDIAVMEIDFRLITLIVLQVWDRHSFTLKDTLRGHTDSVLALIYAKDKRWLFSASGIVLY